MNYAYTPAFDFNPLETDMTFEELLIILKDPTRTDYQRAADIHAALTKATQPSALNIKPKTERKKRATTQKPKSPASDSLNGFAGHVDNEATMPIEIWLTESGKWFWTCRSPNGEVIGDSAEVYSSRAKAVNGVKVIAQEFRQW